MAEFLQPTQQDPDAIRKAMLLKLFGGQPATTAAPSAAGQPTTASGAPPTSPVAKPMATPSTITTAAEPGNQPPESPADTRFKPGGLFDPSNGGGRIAPTVLSESDYEKQKGPVQPHTPYVAPDLKHRMLMGLFAGMQEFGRPGEGAATVRDYNQQIRENLETEKNYPATSAALAHKQYMDYVASAEVPLHIRQLEEHINTSQAQAIEARAKAAALLNPQAKYQRAFIEDPEHPGQGKHADFDPRSGQYIDPDTQKIIPGAKPYAKPEREAGIIPADIEARLGPKPTGDPKNTNAPVQWNGKSYPTERAAQAAWGTAVAKAIDDHARAAGEARGAGFAQTKLMNVLRKQPDGSTVTMAIHPDEMQPGDVLSGASAGEHAMTKTAQLDDIRNSLESVREKAKVLDSGRLDRAVLATALADPNATLSSFAQSEVRNQLNPEEEDYVISVLNAREQIAGLRSLLGAGQVSDARMKLMLQTLPSASTGNSKFAEKQIDRALKDLEILGKGVPKMPAAKDGGKGGGASGGAEYPPGWAPKKKTQ